MSHPAAVVNAQLLESVSHLIAGDPSVQGQAYTLVAISPVLLERIYPNHGISARGDGPMLINARWFVLDGRPTLRHWFLCDGGDNPPDRALSKPVYGPVGTGTLTRHQETP